MAEAAKRLVILGSGPAGYVAAIRATQLGMNVTVVDNRPPGGTCLNRGCIPTKALLAASGLYRHMLNAKNLGLSVEVGPVDWPAIRARQERVVKRLNKGVEALFKAKGIETVNGTASVKDRHTLTVRTPEGDVCELTGDALLIAAGSEAARPTWLGFAADGTPPCDGVLTSDEALKLQTLPESVLIVGGGYIGCEFASLWADLGVKVTVVEMLPTLMGNADEDVATELLRAMKRKRVKALLGTKIEKLSRTDTGVAAELGDGSTVEAQVALVAVGRKLNSDVDGLSALGVEIERGAIKINERCRTSVEGIYAAGDVTGKVLLAHYASHQGVVAVENIAGMDRTTDDVAIPGCAFTNPDTASVGPTEAQAREQLGEVKVGRFDFANLGKAQASGETAGFVKIIADGKTDRIVGVHIVGADASNLIQEATLAVKLGAKLADVAELIHPHPTMTEAIAEAALDALGRAIHKL